VTAYDRCITTIDRLRSAGTADRRGTACIQSTACASPAAFGLPKLRHAPHPVPTNPTPDTDIPAAAPARMPQSARLAVRPAGSGRQQSP